MERSQATGITVILRRLLLKYCRRKIGFKILQENTICFSDWKDTMDKKSVLITGGTSGIGLAAARMFLDKGFLVTIVGRSEQKGRNALEQLGNRDTVQFLRADVKVPEECRHAAEEAEKHWGRIDCLVNSAGVYLEEAAEDLSEESYSVVMDTNLKGTMFMTSLLLPVLRRFKGNIVNVSSDAGLHGNYGCSLYCASKGAVTLYTKAVALEAGHYGVRVNCVCPGDILTPLTEKQLENEPSREDALNEMASVYPLGKIGTVEQAAAVVVFLASEEAGFVTGAAWSVDGGITA